MHLAFLLGLLLSFGSSTPGAPALYSPSLLSVSYQTAITSTATTTTTTPAGSPTIAATSAVTGSTPVSTSTTITATTVSTYTPVAIPTTVPGGSSGNLRINPLDWGFLTQAPNPAMGPLAWVYLILMLGLLGASIYFYAIKRREWKRTNSVLYKAADRFGQPGLWISGVGLLFLLFRVVSLDFFNLRFWLYLWLLAAIALGGWLLYWYRMQYPKEMEKFHKRQRARQYMPGTKGSARVSGTTAAKGGSATVSTSNVAGATPEASTARVVPAGKKKRRRR